MRILGIDDGPFDKFQDKEVRVIGTLFRGGQFMDGLLSTQVEVDGFDSTSKIIDMVKSSKWKDQIRCIMLDGIALGGFNIINAPKVHKETGIPVIIVIRTFPDYERMLSALEKLNMKEKIALIERLEKPKKYGDIYVQAIGIEEKDLKGILKITCTHSLIPEPIRVAHLIASGLAFGQSKGSA